VILLLVACDKNSNNIETNSTSEKSAAPVVIDNLINEAVNDVIKERPKTIKPIIHSFTFQNLKGKSSILTVKNDHYTFSNIKQPIVMIVLASTWCPPCRGEVPHLSNLQKKFKDNLFIMGALIHDDITDSELEKLIISEKVHFYVSSNQKENLRFSDMIIEKLGISSEKATLPLMILFSNGKYFTHYEGSMPEEMIESDIKQLLKKI
jgi:thiol-disulfide isomerase/thioredoxin